MQCYSFQIKYEWVLQEQPRMAGSNNKKKLRTRTLSVWSHDIVFQMFYLPWSRCVFVYMSTCIGIQYRIIPTWLNALALLIFPFMFSSYSDSKYYELCATTYQLHGQSIYTFKLYVCTCNYCTKHLIRSTFVCVLTLV